VQALRDGAAIDLNLAAAGDLELLPGIGPALAQRIVAEREAHGSFVRVSDLHRVRGIGPRTIARLQTLVRIGGTGTASGSTRSLPTGRVRAGLSDR
jgi:competence protein ComEA